MPTGYTSDIYSGKKVTFKQFALQCARAFGALVTMRDDDMDAPIPDEFQPSDYHSKAIKQAEKELKLYEAMTDKEFEKLAESEFDKELKSYEEYKLKNKQLLGRYDSMLVEAKAWVPPTSEHEGLKKFMIEQLKSSIEHDSYYPEFPKKKNADDLRKDKIKHAKRDIAYHAEEHAKEVERAESRTKWVRELKSSFKGQAERVK